jgi:2''-5'' RNA ligase
MTRTFIALEMNEALQRRLKKFSLQVAPQLPSLRWVDVSGIHLTLAFLGELTDEQLDAAVDAAHAVAHTASPFAYRLTQPGIFGPPRSPRVLWMGIVEPSGTLQRLQLALLNELAARDFATDERLFTPHLTLARGKAPLSQDEQAVLQRLLTAQRLPRGFSASYPVTCIHVMKSELQPDGARYTCLARALLRV